MIKMLKLSLLASAMWAVPAAAATDFTSISVTVALDSPGVWSFSVGGWGGGGTVSGFFTGEDVDDDGQLSSFNGEVSDFGASYSGGSLVGAFDLELAGLFGLVYDLDGGVLGDGEDLDIEGIGASGPLGEFSIGPGPVGLCDVGEICGFIDGPDAGVVPEPASWALMIAGFGMVGLASRRRRVPITRA